jgi:hypothetical protein
MENSMKSFSLILLTLGASSLFGSTVYLNDVTDTGNTVQYSANGYTAIGDQITLGGTSRFATDASTQFFNALSTSGTFDTTLSLYSVGVSPAVVGTLLGAYTVTGVPISGFDINNPLTSGTTNVTFFGLNVTVPDSVIFILTIANVSNADLGLTLFDPPTIGSSDNASFITNDGTGFSLNSAGAGFSNVNFALGAIASGGVPEPASLLMMGGGLAGLVVFYRRRRLARFGLFPAR